MVGTVERISGPIVTAALTGLEIGAVCEIKLDHGESLLAEVIGLKDHYAYLTPYGPTQGLSCGAEIRKVAGQPELLSGSWVLGRILDTFGVPLDGTPAPKSAIRIPLKDISPAPMDRKLISEPIVTGCRAIDGFLTIGRGQRMAIMGAAGTGKSTLLQMLVTKCDADVIVVGLIGERGREVKEFYEEVAKAGMADRLVIVAATSDRPAIERALCAHSASSTAEFFQRQGKSVLLLIDSLTRTARALREIGLAMGEVPSRRGYPASVYPVLPEIIERAGNSNMGSITGLYTVLMEDNASSDPIAEEVKSLTDGHIQLDRKIAASGRYPAIDIMSSISRSMTRITTEPHLEAAQSLRKLVTAYQDVALLLKMGEYEYGTDPDTDQAISMHSELETFLAQRMDDVADFDGTLSHMIGLAQ